MLTEQIYQFALACGGVTYDLKAFCTVGEGYAVSPYGYAERKRPLTELNIQGFISENYALLCKANNCMGLWFNDGDNEWYFDVVKVVQSKSEAHRIAKASSQIAFFDLKNKTEIRV